MSIELNLNLKLSKIVFNTFPLVSTTPRKPGHVRGLFKIPKVMENQ